jgi:mRNA interferase YafQ
MYEIIATNQFKKYYKQCMKRKFDIELLDDLAKTLAITGTVPQKHKPHILSGNQSGRWECHVKPNWLLIWVKDEKLKTITLISTGTHSDLF